MGLSRRIRIHRQPGITDVLAYNGCTRAHMALLTQALHTNPHFKYIMVFEDDFQLQLNNSVWKKTVCDFWTANPQADVLMLNCNLLTADYADPGNDHASVSYRWVRVRQGLSMSAVMIRREYAFTLLKIFRQAYTQNNPLDVQWLTAQRRSKWYALRPALGKQRAGYSDIEHGYRNYGV